jgi:hypothetical protein
MRQLTASYFIAASRTVKLGRGRESTGIWRENRESREWSRRTDRFARDEHRRLFVHSTSAIKIVRRKVKA